MGTDSGCLLPYSGDTVYDFLKVSRCSGHSIKEYGISATVRMGSDSGFLIGGSDKFA